MLPLAHAGHVIADLIYVGPVLVVVVWVSVRALLEQRRERLAAASRGPGPDPPA